jgi:hypothetical protein
MSQKIFSQEGSRLHTFAGEKRPPMGTEGHKAKFISQAQPKNWMVILRPCLSRGNTPTRASVVAGKRLSIKILFLKNLDL